jgi:hypothetical protein
MPIKVPKAWASKMNLKILNLTKQQESNIKLIQLIILLQNPTGVPDAKISLPGRQQVNYDPLLK